MLGIATVAIMFLLGGLYVMLHIGHWKTLSCQVASNGKTAVMLLISGSFLLLFILAVGESLLYIESKRKFAKTASFRRQTRKHFISLLSWVGGVFLFGSIGWFYIDNWCH